MRLTLFFRLFIPLALIMLLGLLAFSALNHFFPQQSVFSLMGVAIATLLLCAMRLRADLQDMLTMFRTLAGTVLSYRDGDFSFGLHWRRNDEIADLVETHNELGRVLREQRLDLVQRELLLDTMLQNTPVAMILVAENASIVFANIAARQLLNQGRKLEGFSLTYLQENVSPALRDALSSGADGLFSASPQHNSDRNTADGSSDVNEDEEEIYHLSRRHFSLNGRRHELLLLRHLTTELRRQEVQTWKKVIRVISHELNNSLAPVASLAVSGAELLRRGNVERLPEIFSTIEERSRHLEEFIAGYARFAKLPQPNRQHLAWGSFFSRLQSQMSFQFIDDEHAPTGFFDPAQMEQALLNLLKNAHESGSSPQDIHLAVRRMHQAIRIDVSDHGGGMNEQIMAQALVPFYSTKRSGTGLGLALSREIIEAHGGRILLTNQERDGVVFGLTVSLILPD